MSMRSSQHSYADIAMVHLFSAIKLKSSVSAAAFTEAIRQLSASLEQQQLLTTTGPIGKRLPHPIMDTDEADLETFLSCPLKTGLSWRKW